MVKSKKNGNATKSNGATVDDRARLWQIADALRGSMDAAECVLRQRLLNASRVVSSERIAYKASGRALP
jgi:hypothetical protein